jgi:hypothetical protein
VKKPAEIGVIHEVKGKRAGRFKGVCGVTPVSGHDEEFSCVKDCFYWFLLHYSSDIVKRLDAIWGIKDESL